MLRAFFFLSAFVMTGLWCTRKMNTNSTAPNITLNPAGDTGISRIIKNYTGYCGGCHGNKMDAFVDRSWKHGSTRSDLFKAIKQGYADEGMPDFDITFTDEETYELADYILTGIENRKRYDFKKDTVQENFFPSKDIDIRLDTIVKISSVGWGMKFLPNGDILYTEKSGKLFRVTTNKIKQEINGMPGVQFAQQGGLMDIELYPQFSKNNVLYISYSAIKKSGGKNLSTTAIMGIIKSQCFNRTENNF